MAELLRTNGSKFITLSHRLDIPVGSLRQTLEHLLEQNWVVRNPGYGHPLRPEYILTEPGREVAMLASRIFTGLQDEELAEVLYRKWSLPCLAACRHGDRYSSIKAQLPGITDRALSAALRELTEHKVLVRMILETYPPTTVYQVRENWLGLAALLEVN